MTTEFSTLTPQNQKPRINITTELRHQNAYTLALNGEYADVAFDEIRAPLNKFCWRRKVFSSPVEIPLDLEIGTGAGTHFAYYCHKNPDRRVIGMELKYKPLIQTIRRALNLGAKNAAVTRFHAFDIEQLFAENELDNIMIHFPDPWVSPRKPKNRTVSALLLNVLYKLQRPGSILEFKTDSLEYFDWSLEEILKTPYKMTFMTKDLHRSEMATQNFETTFEKIFLRQGVKINYLRLEKPTGEFC